MRTRTTLLGISAAALMTVGSLAITPTARAEDKKVDFVKDVQPILAESCVKCHGADPKGKKPKGGLDLTTKEKAFKTGDNKGNFVLGKPEESLMYKTLLGPVGSGDDEIGRMPYKKDPLPQAQIDIIKNWIKEGATWPDGVKVELKE